MYTMLAQQVVNDMVAHSLGTFGTDLFIGELGPNVSEGVFLVPSFSTTPNLYVDTQEQVIDFWCRSDHTTQAFSKLQEVYNLYHRRGNYPLGDWYIYFSHVTGTITDMDRDRENGKLVKLSILFLCRNTNTVS